MMSFIRPQWSIVLRCRSIPNLSINCSINRPVDSKGVAAAPVALPSSTAAAEESGSRNNMISQMHISSASSRKRPFDALDGSGKNDTAAAACSSTMSDTNEPSSSIEALLKVMQHKMNCMQTKFEERMDDMQTEINATRDENADLETKCYELESKMEDISSLKDEQKGTYDNNERMYDMQTEIDTLRDENNELKTKYNELEIKVKDLTLKNEYNEWSYTAEDIPASYWVERGFAEEEYAERMVEFLGEMNEYTHQLRRGESPKSIELSFTNDHMLHDDILLPHWKEFADALQQYQKFNHREDYGIDIFRIRNVQLQQEVLEMLSSPLQILDIKFLGLDGNIGSDVLSFAERIVQRNHHLEQVGWRNQIESVDDMRQLCNSIKNTASSFLKAIGLYNSFDGNNLELMRIVLDASLHLKALRLVSNGIGTAGVSLITNWLSSNPQFWSLDLTGNNLNDTDATILVNALQSNTHLRQIYLNNNNITTVGRQALLESVFDVSNLSSCAASNHKCCIHGLTPDISDINKYTSSLNRIMKIFTMLSATDHGFFNMTCLGDDISYKLIPNVLRLSQEFTARTPGLSEAYFLQTGQRSADWSRLNEDTVPLTSMFELLRGWAVPSLSD